MLGLKTCYLLVDAFLNFYKDLIFMHVYVMTYVHGGKQRVKEGAGTYGVGVTGCRRLSDVGAGD